MVVVVFVVVCMSVSVCAYALMRRVRGREVVAGGKSG